MDKPYNYDHLIWEKRSLPDKINEDEDIVLIVREDLIVPALKGVGLFLIFFLLLLIRVAVVTTATSILLSLYDTLFFGITTLLIIAFVYIYHNYYLSMQIITNERIIDIDQKSLFNREINFLTLQNIEDVNYKLSGFWGTVFNYGNIIVQTSGEGSSGGNAGSEDKVNGFTFNNAPNPKYITNVVNKLIHQNEETDRIESARANAEAMRNIFRNNQQ